MLEWIDAAEFYKVTSFTFKDQLLKLKQTAGKLEMHMKDFSVVITCLFLVWQKISSHVFWVRELT